MESHQPKDDRNVDQVDSVEEHHAVESNAESIPARGSKVKGSNNGGLLKEVVEWIKALVIAVVLVFVIRAFLFSPFIVDGDSMLPNFESGERLIVNKIVYTFGEPKFGDVVVFDVPEEGRKFIKRVIGVPGDTIRIEGDKLYINGELREEPYIKEVIDAAQAIGQQYNWGPNADFPNQNVSETVVPEGTIFALGDNRSDSKDSRTIGFVTDKEVIGRADLIFWPLNKIEFIKHGQ